ncbi:DUF4363 family protein [Alkaliphilus peptidifermentans]|uniref:DUF4363 family protein n=1 Tax=Alkaliphilus peptidifermentans DSM 18978 TaxID=1120976 RepID=A0A1G5J2C5_9FIRM|nr:DUF4363 family protein [Alkaliphilus peptidifermentans]SCY82417.1 protein of unknown function [Alkaliphilus peptidifermentans DSM 18978]
MKTVIITLVILITFFIGAVIFQQYVENSCKTLLAHIERLDESILAENWEEAENNIQDLRKEWEQKKKIWEVVLEHYDLDAIEIAITKIERYTEVNEKIMTLGEIVQLKFLIRHVSDRESFRLSNLL